MLRIRAAFRLCAIVSLSALFCLSALSQEKKINKKDLPGAVLSAFEKAYPKATIKGLSTEVEEGKTYYEIESVDGKISRDLLYLADGSVAEIEEGVSTADLPAPVKATLHKEYPKGKVKKAEKTTKGTTVTYEMKVSSGKTNAELVVDPTGKVIKNEKAGAMKKQKEEKEESEQEEKD
jgi:hypothetical protein